MPINAALKASLLDDAVRESISGLMSEYRTYFRSVGGFEGSTQRIPISLEKLQIRTQLRLDGMHTYINMGTLTIHQLRKSLTAIGLRIDEDSVVFEVAVPAARSAHVR